MLYKVSHWVRLSHVKNYADLGRNTLSTLVDNTLLDLHNSSYHTQSHPIIVEYKN